MILLNLVLKKLHIESLAVPNRGVFLNTRLLWSGTTQDFQMYPVALHILCTAHTLHCLERYFLPSHQQQLCPVCVCWNLQSVSLAVLLGHLGVHCFSGHCSVLHLGSAGPWTSDMQDLPNPMQEGLLLLFGLCFYVSYTKNGLKIAQFSRYNNTFLRPWRVFLGTELLVCPIYVLHEFIVMDSSLRNIYFQVSSVLSSCIHYCCNMHHAYHSHKSFILPHLDCYVTFPPECWLPVVSSGLLPILGQMECHY